MKNLSFEQRIALQIGELVLEVKRLETIRDQMVDQLSKLAEEKQSSEVREIRHPSRHHPQDTPESSASTT